VTAAEVLEFYTTLERDGVRIWIDGGWGVDALLGEQTRPHGDLDIAIQEKDVRAGRELLESRGYREVRRDSEWNFVMGDDNGHEIDFHSFVFDASDRVVEGVKYPDGSLTGTGSIDGQEVRCVAPEHMVKFRAGYELRERDIQDVTALCERFRLEYPKGFR